MAKSKQDKSADHEAAEDRLPEADTVTPDKMDTIETAADTVAAEADTGDARSSEDPTDVPAEPAEEAPKPEMVPDEGVDLSSAEADDTLASEVDTAKPAPEFERDPAPVAAAAPQVIRETVVERKGGFVPTLLGGVVAAALGYAAGAWPDLPFMGSKDVVEDPFVTQTNAALRGQAEQIAGLTARADENAAAIAAIDLGPVTSAVSGIEGTLGGLQSSVDGLTASLGGIETTVAGLSDGLAGLDARLTEIEKAPLKDAVSPETIAAYEREIEALKSDVAAQQAAVAEAQKAQLAAMEAAKAEIEGIAARARDAEASADTRARLAASRAALADVMTRARDGRPYDEPLAVLTGNGVDVPAALAEGAAAGLPLMGALISSFPEAARDALSAARAAGEGGADPGSVTGFLQRQLGARSVTPREGDDPDAVLSRAEAALQGGDLDVTLAELAKLPESAQTEMSDWVAKAQLRRDALAAAAALTQELNQE